MSAVTPFNPINISLFQPSQIAGLALWLDAADSSTVVTSGANVTQWNDKSSNAHICISNANYAGTTLPTYNSNAIYKNVNFADTQALVTSSNWNYSPSWSCFVALNTVNLGARWLISPHNSIPTPVFMGMNQGTNKIFQNAFNSAPADITGNHIEYTSAENTSAISNLLWYRDGILQASNVKNLGGINSSTLLKMGIGANGTVGNSMAGTYQLYEVLIFNSYLSSTQRQQIESYLVYKWNLQSNLPTSHPYYNSPYNAYPPFTNINQTIRFAYPVLPTNIAGLSLWLDAADGSTLFQNTAGTTPVTNGSQVQLWKDKSSSANNATNSQTVMTYNGNGLNGLPAISFPGTQTSGFSLSGALLPNGSSDASYFFVLNKNNGATQVFFTHGGATQLKQFFSSGGLSIDRAGQTLINDGTSIVNLNTIVSCTQTSLSAGVNGWRNGSVFSSTGATITWNVDTTAAWLGSGGTGGGNFQYAGVISEVIVYNNALTTAQRQAVESYLAYKWNLQGSLPVTHPYYNNAFIPNLPRSVPITIIPYIYSPRSLSGLALWLDAADANSVSRTGVNVTAWIDKSGNGRDVNPTTNAFQYVSAFNGSYPTLSSDIAGGNGQIGTISGFTLPNPSIVFAVIQNLATMTGPSRFPYIFNIGASSNRAYAYSRNQGAEAGRLRIASGNNSDIEVTPPLLLTTAQVFTMEMGASSTLTYTNGLLIGNTTMSGATITSSSLSIGGNGTASQWTGHFCEFIIFTSPLTVNQRQAVEGYLAWKWALQKSLPSNHPFYLFPPG